MADAMEKLQNATMLATLGTECVVLWDDVTDKLEDCAQLIEELGLTQMEIDEATRILRKFSDAAHDLKNQVAEQVTAQVTATAAPRQVAAHVAKEPEGFCLDEAWAEAEALHSDGDRVFAGTLLPTAPADQAENNPTTSWGHRTSGPRTCGT